MEIIKTYKDDKLVIQVEDLAHTIIITWLGECSAKNPVSFLGAILEEQYKISCSKSKKLIFDFTKTQYMNSSAIIPIIKFLKMIGEKGGVIQVKYNRFERWQSVLIGELKMFETEDGRIQIIGVDK